jgi:hypothetical protein
MENNPSPKSEKKHPSREYDLIDPPVDLKILNPPVHQFKSYSDRVTMKT